jgi:hypothetical protein
MALVPLISARASAAVIKRLITFVSPERLFAHDLKRGAPR